MDQLARPPGVRRFNEASLSKGLSAKAMITIRSKINSAKACKFGNLDFAEKRVSITIGKEVVDFFVAPLYTSKTNDAQKKEYQVEGVMFYRAPMPGEYPTEEDIDAYLTGVMTLGDQPISDGNRRRLRDEIKDHRERLGLDGSAEGTVRCEYDRIFFKKLQSHIIKATELVFEDTPLVGIPVFLRQADEIFMKQKGRLPGHIKYLHWMGKNQEERKKECEKKGIKQDARMIGLAPAGSARIKSMPISKEILFQITGNVNVTPRKKIGEILTKRGAKNKSVSPSNLINKEYELYLTNADKIRRAKLRNVSEKEIDEIRKTPETGLARVFNVPVEKGKEIAYYLRTNGVDCDIFYKGEHAIVL